MSDLAGVLPLTSIITPSFQQAAFLADCLRSVREQAEVQVEHIVVDGGSTDGSRAIIERNADQMAWWCSEKDEGQSHAINKGLAHASGEVFGWLNSDDALLPGALKRVAAAFAADPGLLVYGGRLIHLGPDGEKIFERMNDPKDEMQLFCDPVVNQQSTFWRMHAVKAIGGVDQALRYVMDLELWWQVLFRFGTAHLKFEPVELALFRLHADSKTIGQHKGFLDETASLLRDMCLRTGHDRLAEVLATGYDIRNGLRGVPVNETHRERVYGMVWHFLLKWNAGIHHAAQFEMMRMLRAARLDTSMLSDELNHRWERVDAQLGVGSWNLFRVKRKLEQLFS